MIPTIHLVDDDESFLRSMDRRLRAHGYYVATHNSVASFLANRDPDAPGCVLADLQMPKQNGFDLQEALAQSPNPLTVVFVTGKGDIPTSVRAMRQGAEDFLTKRVPTTELIAAIERAVARDVRERAERVRKQEARRQIVRLTGRELQMLLGIVKGMQNKEMAEVYGMSERTVKFHRTQLTRRLDLTAVADLTRLVLDAGLSIEELAEMAAQAPPGPRQS
jgi:two-component system response regulator FixJ